MGKVDREHEREELEVKTGLFSFLLPWHSDVILMPAIPPLPLPGESGGSPNTHTHIHTHTESQSSTHSAKMEYNSRISGEKRSGLYLKEAVWRRRRSVWWRRGEREREFGNTQSNGNFFSNHHICACVCSLIHVLLPSYSLLFFFISARRVAVWHGSWWNRIEPSKNRVRSLRSCLSAPTGTIGAHIWRTHHTSLLMPPNHHLLCFCFVLSIHLQVGGVLSAVLQRDAMVGSAIFGWGSAITTQQTLWNTRYLAATSSFRSSCLEMLMSLVMSLNKTLAQWLTAVCAGQAKRQHRLPCSLREVGWFSSLQSCSLRKCYASPSASRFPPLCVCRGLWMKLSGIGSLSGLSCKECEECRQERVDAAPLPHSNPCISWWWELPLQLISVHMCNASDKNKWECYRCESRQSCREGESH